MNKIDKKFIEKEFVRFFVKNPNASYKDFNKYLCQNSLIPQGLQISYLIDNIRKNLQNNKVLKCLKRNDGSGHFYSEKIIDINKYNEYSDR